MRARQGILTLAFALAAVTMSGATWSAWAQQTRGEARIGGKVVDDAGKPAANVVVKAQLTGQMPPLQTKTNNKGEWSINNMAGGVWELEFSKEGFAPQRITLDLKPDQRISNMEVKLAPPAPDPNAEIQAEVKRAAELFQNKQIAEGRKVYETLLVKYPTLHQLHEFIGRTYAAEGQYDQAVEHVRIAVEKDPENVQAKVFLGDLLMEKGDKAEAQKILDSVDLTKVEDPAPFINLAIGKINEQKSDEALALLEKLMARFPKDASLFYYRGRANLAAKKLPEAKADLEKFVSMALPDARELPDARRILEQMKDVK
ncbi:MAG: tetratricopeptide repeat protein [Vicinamibacterales bacterium]